MLPKYPTQEDLNAAIPPQRRLTVGDLRRALDGIADDMEVKIVCEYHSAEPEIAEARFEEAFVYDGKVVEPAATRFFIGLEHSRAMPPKGEKS
jgi:hypothetical protein